MSGIDIKIYSLEPVLLVNNLEETIKYYQEILGFNLDWTWPEDGRVEHASVSFGQGHSQEHYDEQGDDQHEDHHVHIQLTQAENTPVSNSGWLYLRVEEEIDELYENMKSRGANIDHHISDQPWGMREFDILDNNGHRYRFGYPIS